VVGFAWMLQSTFAGRVCARHHVLQPYFAVMNADTLLAKTGTPRVV